MVTAARPQTVSRWAVDPSHTVVEFAVRHLMVTTVKGRFTRFSGTLALDEAVAEGRALLADVRGRP